MNNLTSRIYNEVVHFKNTDINLFNVKVQQWSLASAEDSIIYINNSNLGDTKYSSMNGRIIIDNSNASFLVAKEYVTIEANNSQIASDVIATDNGIIVLKNVSIGGKIVRMGKGQVIESKP